jgi:hypothetical protein
MQAMPPLLAAVYGTTGGFLYPTAAFSPLRPGPATHTAVSPAMHHHHHSHSHGHLVQCPSPQPQQQQPQRRPSAASSPAPSEKEQQAQAAAIPGTEPAVAAAPESKAEPEEVAAEEEGKASSSSSSSASSSAAAVAAAASGPAACEVIVRVPGAMIARLVGKEGETLRRIRGESGCHVTISNPRPAGAGEAPAACRMLRIQGSIAQAQHAQRLIAEEIAAAAPAAEA